MVLLGVLFPLQNLLLDGFTSYQPYYRKNAIASLASSAPRSLPKALESVHVQAI